MHSVKNEQALGHVKYQWSYLTKSHGVELKERPDAETPEADATVHAGKTIYENIWGIQVYDRESIDNPFN